MLASGAGGELKNIRTPRLGGRCSPPELGENSKTYAHENWGKMLASGAGGELKNIRTPELGGTCSLQEGFAVCGAKALHHTPQNSRAEKWTKVRVWVAAGIAGLGVRAQKKVPFP